MPAIILHLFISLSHLIIHLILFELLQMHHNAHVVIMGLFIFVALIKYVVYFINLMHLVSLINLI